MSSRLFALGLATLALVACTGDLDPQWQLDHDRIVAVRATPPSIASGAKSTIDGLIARVGDTVQIAGPEQATVVSPMSLADTLALEGGSWVVTAPSEDRLVAARAELELAAGAPVPLQIGVAYSGQTLLATKTVLLGAAADHPALTNVMINGAPGGTAEIVIGKLVDVPLSVEANDEDFDVAWLTSCGTMHDFDLPAAYVHVEDDDPTEGELVLVVRDAGAGVAWQRWTIRAE
ncbi:MAG: hypothetical protein H7138_22270 [Myxococcales bacterium]|nr:hypothetical protein [Myxococcales bacterium]